jgi:hypothetical protein
MAPDGARRRAPNARPDSCAASTQNHFSNAPSFRWALEIRAKPLSPQLETLKGSLAHGPVDSYDCGTNYYIFMK